MKKIIKIKNLIIKEYKDSIDSDYKHFSASKEGSNFIGFGSSEKKSLAIKIAVNEWFEREAFTSVKSNLKASTTNGFASHNTKELAKEASLCEALERDAPLTSWLLKRPVKWINSKDLSIKISEQLIKFTLKNLFAKVGVICISNDRYCCIGVLQTHQKNTVFSTSCNKSLEQALLGILKDLRHAATVILNRANTNLSTDSVNLLKKSIFWGAGQDHFEYYMDPNNFSDLEWLLTQKSKVIPQYKYIIHTQLINLKKAPEWSYFVAYSQSQYLQKFYFGSPSFSDINRKSIKKLWTKGQKLNKSLHYLS